MAKPTLPNFQVHFAKWQNPHCPIVKSILPNGKIHIAQLLSQKEAERQGGAGGWWVSLGSL
jgi:hypothetical protein